MNQYYAVSDISYSMKAIWEAVKTEIKNRIPHHSYRMWMEPLEFEASENGALVLSCPNIFFKKRVQDQYGDLIETLTKEATGKPFSLFLKVSGRKASKKKQVDSAIQLVLPHEHLQSYSGRRLRKEFTFDHFVVGANNDFAFCAALALASGKNTQKNSLFLISKTGLGKSHLSQAAGQYILSEKPSERVFYITAEDFTNEMVQAFRQGDINAFKKKYRDGCDVLLMEDIHYLSGKERTQVELALTLESLMEANKKIIFSSCYTPSDIPKFNDKLRSCLNCGLISPIEPPDYRTRVRILKKKSQTNGYPIPEEVTHYLASELTEDVRQLESGLIGVTAKSSLLGIPVNLSLAESVVKNIARVKKSITIDVIKKLVCKQFKVSVGDVVSRSRKQCFVRPRQIAMYLSRQYTDSPLQTIGKSFNRYHATALHAISTIEKEIKKNTVIREQVAFLSERLESGKF